MKEEDLMAGLVCASALFFPLRKTMCVCLCVYLSMCVCVCVRVSVHVCVCSGTL